MKERIHQAIFSSSGASLAVGAAGFLSAVVTMFINTSLQISIKWLLLFSWIFLTLVIVLLKLVFDLSNEKIPPSPYETPIRYLSDDGILLIRRNENFANQIVVGCYSNIDDVERLIFLGSVYHVQEQFIQIKLIEGRDIGNDRTVLISDLKSIVVRPVVPLSAIQSLGNSEAKL